MKQLLGRKHGTRTIVFALLLTMLAWLAPVNVGVAKAADDHSAGITQNKTLKTFVKSKEPLYKQCAKKTYASKYRFNKELVCVKFGKVSGKKIKLYLGRGTWNTGEFDGTRALTGTVKGKTIKFKTKTWYSADEGGGLYRWNDKVSGTITLVNNKTIKLKITSSNRKGLLKAGKTTTLRHDSNSKGLGDNFQYLY